jgi:hypothetical protein
MRVKVKKNTNKINFIETFCKKYRSTASFVKKKLLIEYFQCE